MILGEQGSSLAQLNAGILLNKIDVFPNSEVSISNIATQNGDNDLNINRHLAFKFYTLASKSEEVSADAFLKLGDMHYYGIATDVDYKKSLDLYARAIEKPHASVEVTSQALLSLGMMYQFGWGSEKNLEIANSYYDRLLQDSKSTTFAPVYLLSLMSRWE